jgi:hypothetical protein
MTIAKRIKGVPSKKREAKKSNSIKKLLPNKKINTSEVLKTILPELEDEFITNTSILNNILE